MNFIAEQNIARFQTLLDSEVDPGKRATLERLLEEERAKIIPIPSAGPRRA